jgi:adenosylmethionine-8-amino-7-oxononanoate aminotransferase
LVDRDRASVWHPATHFGDVERLPPIPIVRAEGPWLYTEGGRRVLDAIASWWTSVHGHGHPRIARAVAEQVARLDHVLLAGFTHEGAVALAERLLAAAGGHHGKVFFADCGAAAIEVALKLAFQWHAQSGAPQRRRFAALRGGYHGETLGALAACGGDEYRRTFAPLLPDVLFLPAPRLDSHEHADLAKDAGADAPQTDEAIALLDRHGDELAALVVEPMVQCAGKMAMTGAGFYRRVVAAAQRRGILVVADEIAVALGRTGRLFAGAWSPAVPDLVCLAKALSAGTVPLGAVLVRAGLERAFEGDPARSFAHSHTYCGNPIACAAALAGLDLLTEDGGTLAQLPARIEALAQRRRDVARRCGAVAAHRQAGMIAAFDLDPRATAKIADGRVGLALRAAALERGVLLRPLGGTVYWMPPLLVDDDALDQLADATAGAIAQVCA